VYKKRSQPSQPSQRKKGTASEFIPLSVAEVRRLLYRLLWKQVLWKQVLWKQAAPPPFVVAWSQWRRRHQLRAKRCHYKTQVPYG
ncbi:MAG TPA: hypothetical protein VF600_15880, partial [Abditibacteriaceae bacterium]